MSIYFDDLIYTGNDDKMIRDFKKSMEESFDMNDLGEIKCMLSWYRHNMLVVLVRDKESIHLMC